MGMPDNHPGRESAPDEILRERKRRIFSWRTMVFLAVSLLLAWLLLRQMDIAGTVDMIRKADPLLIAACCAVYVLSNISKMLRFRVMLGDYRIPLFDLFTITSYHNFSNMVFPARTGELTFVYYLKKIGGVDMTKGLHILVVTRIFDFIIIAIYFLCSLVLFFGRETSVALVAAGIVFLVISVIILFNLKWLVILCGRLFHMAADRPRYRDRPLVKKAMGLIDVLVGEFSSFKTGKFVPLLALTTMLVWAVLYFIFFLSIRALGVEVGFIQSVAGSTGSVLTNVLPINSFGSFGTLEAGWTGGFMLVGMGKQDAIFTGFGFHVICLLASAIPAFFCFIAARIGKK
ncbi:MAG TPA: lysylphosphatidylglycerol synthase transmembrane domain-containing protein [Spirochaetota bacterium]|nr:flippase-like domain-containing protein [Spirochaetota bacterium]HOD16473.1 lysylphosphatidylglycerol synthase transmembrane domain-containing protein [Spirochaetota bacterium]HPG50179.1 lysylphosphatidylglycerol synthase transmembrane domain-containing protein [Spirochaetota bacterium]HPN12487.1 lysylphosphatidylglycerol synthase transmembrane domain-containing protein [Spirochaetota bacterium]HQL80787.1 lysylphosphatidylglycerol synthase transmembrane domain-containing protein [Spirochaeto